MSRHVEGDPLGRVECGDEVRYACDESEPVALEAEGWQLRPAGELPRWATRWDRRHDVVAVRLRSTWPSTAMAITGAMAPGPVIPSLAADWDERAPEGARWANNPLVWSVSVVPLANVPLLACGEMMKLWR